MTHRTPSLIGKVDLVALDRSLKSEVADQVRKVVATARPPTPSFAEPFAPMPIRQASSEARPPEPSMAAYGFTDLRRLLDSKAQTTGFDGVPTTHVAWKEGMGTDSPRADTSGTDGLTSRRETPNGESRAEATALPDRNPSPPSVVSYSFESIRKVAGERPAPPGGHDLGALVRWSERTSFPKDADAFADEVVRVIEGHGTTGLRRDVDSGDDGRRGAVEAVRVHGRRLYREALEGLARDGYVRGVPWIAARVQHALFVGGSTEEADRSIGRFARMDRTSVPSMYRSLSRQFGLRMETVDIVLWTAFAYGMGEAR